MEGQWGLPRFSQSFLTPHKADCSHTISSPSLGWISVKNVAQVRRGSVPLIPSTQEAETGDFFLIQSQTG